MSDLRKAAQQALEAMLNFPDDISDEMFESIRALRAALAQQAEPVQKPVAWVECDGELVWNNREAAIGRNLYTTPPQRPPLTDEEIAEVYREWDVGPWANIAEFARAIERRVRGEA